MNANVPVISLPTDDEAGELSLLCWLGLFAFIQTNTGRRQFTRLKLHLSVASGFVSVGALGRHSDRGPRRGKAVVHVDGKRGSRPAVRRGICLF